MLAYSVAHGRKDEQQIVKKNPAYRGYTAVFKKNIKIFSMVMIFSILTQKLPLAVVIANRNNKFSQGTLSIGSEVTVIFQGLVVVRVYIQRGYNV